MMELKKNIWMKSGIGVLISVAFLWLALRKVQWEAFWGTFQEISLVWATAAFLIPIVVCMVRAWRWHYLFLPVGRMRYANLFSVIMIGFLANNVLPARLGDLVMAHFIGKKEDISKSLAFGTILIDRIMDVTTLLVLLIIALLSHPFPAWVNRIANYGTLLLFLGLSVIISLIFFTDFAVRVIAFLLRPLPSGLSTRILDILSRLVQGFAVLKEGGLILRVLAISMLIWILLGLGVYFLFRSFSFPLPFWSSFFILAVVNLGLVIPSSPGFVGTFQFFCVAALMIFGVSKTTGLSFSVVYHLSQYVPTTLLGFVYLAKEQLRLGNLVAITEGAEGDSVP